MSSRIGAEKMNGDVPVGCGRDRYGLSTDTHRVDLSGVRPRDRAHRNGEAAYEEIGADNDALRDALVTVDNPNT